jgi:hypothetical protein
MTHSATGAERKLMPAAPSGCLVIDMVTSTAHAAGISGGFGPTNMKDIFYTKEYIEGLGWRIVENRGA